MHLIVIVLGDLGRSPRMQYHCQSLLDAGHSVTAIGYNGEELIESLAQLQVQQNQHDQTVSQPQVPTFQVIRFKVPTLPLSLGSIKILYFVWRIVSLSLILFWILLVSVKRKTVDFVLIQNPPALPIMFVAYCYCRIQAIVQGRRPGFIIDWHNLGFSMLPSGSIVQQIAQIYEKQMAPLADGHMTVTHAMKDYLKEDMNISRNIDVLYDCPMDIFYPLQVAEQHQLLSNVHNELCQVCPRSWWYHLDDAKQTLLTEEQVNGQVRHRPDRPALITSSTSWTQDEDFGVLFDALQLLDARIMKLEKSLQFKVLVVVTGKGPERSMYEQRITQLSLLHVAIATTWLKASDYPKLLACADLGVSLHTSTSGLDLPMKILDLFGCEVPVVAYRFSCLSELVQDEVQGSTFTTSQQLCNLLYELLHPLASKRCESLPNHSFGSLETYSKNLRNLEGWNANWLEHALPVILRSAQMK